jgi:hypothetical protein
VQHGGETEKVGLYLHWRDDEEDYEFKILVKACKFLISWLELIIFT